MKSHRRPHALLATALAATVGAPTVVHAQPPPTPAPDPSNADGGPAGSPTAPAAPEGGEQAEPTPPPEEATDDAIDAALLDAALGATEGDDEAVDDADDAPRGPLRLRVVEVTLRREDPFRETGASTRVTEAELAQQRSADPTAVVARAPGVTIRTEDGFGLRPNIGMRGTNPDRSSRVTLMEDGVLFGPAPYSAPAAYYFPLVLRMTGVDVYRGASSILYGPATVAGAVDLRTRTIRDGEQGRADLAYGMFGTRRVHVYYGQGHDHAGFLLEGVDVASDGFKTLDFAPDDTGFHRGEYLARGYLQTDEDDTRFHRVELRLGYSLEDSRETYLGLTDEDFRQDPYRRYLASANDRMIWQRGEVRLDHRFEHGDALSVTTTAYRHDFARTWRRLEGFAGAPETLNDILTYPELPTYARFYEVLTGARASTVDPTMRSDETLMQAVNERRYVSQGVQSTLTFDEESAQLRHHLEAGVRLHQDSITSDQRLRGYLVETSPSPHLVRDGYAPEQVTDRTASTVAAALYATYALDFGIFRAAPGVRTEIIHSRVDDRLNDLEGRRTTAVVLPGLTFTTFATEWLAVFAGVHRGFSPIGAGQSDAIRPETSISYEAGARLDHEASRTQAELVGFFNDYRNILLTCSGSTSCSAAELDTQFNGGSANVGGLEALVRHTLRLGDAWRMPMRASYALTMASFRHVEPGITTPGYMDAQDGSPLAFVPTHQGQVQLGLEGHGFTANVQLAVTGEMRENSTEDRDEAWFTDRIAMLDASVSYALSPRVRLYVRGENLTNAAPLASRRPFGARPVKPLIAMAGLELDLARD